MSASPDDRPTRIVVVGSGWRFLSGISYYTCRLSNALASRYEVGAILMRQLLPTRLYPGRSRVGQRLNDLDYADGVRVFDGIDWWAVPSLIRAVRFLRSFRPDVLVLQWWTGTVLHSYLILCLAARLLKIKVVVEFHEVQDTGEAAHKWASLYCRKLIRPLLRGTDGVVVHSRFDRVALRQTYDLTGVPDVIAIHGPFDHHAVPAPRAAEPGRRRLLFFGTIRPYKGLEDLIEAFALLPDDYELTVVGETWEGWTLPASLIEASPAASRITFVNRYVTDAEVDGFFAAADMVVLPYRRSSASGPLHIAMSHGLPVVVTAVGGLVEAAEEYSGAVFAAAASPSALAASIEAAMSDKAGRRHTDPSSWERSVASFESLFTEIGVVPVGHDAVITASSNQTVPLFSPDLR
ncbi:glycosyltransferase [Actinoplanes sp. NPDC048796]|uniref:glycosyltransferase n=1 Tax=Actinoplanes sp. NPDC048796 TaxID=3155640 RepID=UPI0033FBD457